MSGETFFSNSLEIIVDILQYDFLRGKGAGKLIHRKPVVIVVAGTGFRNTGLKSGVAFIPHGLDQTADGGGGGVAKLCQFIDVCFCQLLYMGKTQAQDGLCSAGWRKLVVVIQHILECGHVHSLL